MTYLAGGRNMARGKTLHLLPARRWRGSCCRLSRIRGLLGEGPMTMASTAASGGPICCADERIAHFSARPTTPLWYYVLQGASIFGTPTHLHAGQT